MPTKIDTPAVVSRVLSEDVLSISEARDELAKVTGHRVDRSTIFRWVHRGCGGIRLDAVRAGNQILTSRQSLTRFIAARTASSVGA